MARSSSRARSPNPAAPVRSARLDRGAQRLAGCRSVPRSALGAAQLDQRREQGHPGLRSLRLADRLLQQADRLIAIVLAQPEADQRGARRRRRAEGPGHAHVLLGQAQGFVALLGGEEGAHRERRPVRRELGPRPELGNPAVAQLGQLAQRLIGLAEREVEASPGRLQEPERRRLRS